MNEPLSQDSGLTEPMRSSEPHPASHPGEVAGTGDATPRALRQRPRGSGRPRTPAPARDAVQLALFPLHPESSLPRHQLYRLQGGRCARCHKPVAPDGRVKWDRHRTRIAGIVCHGCSLRSDPLPSPSPVEQVSPLLRLRLSLGPIPNGDLAVSEADRKALADGNLDQFRNPAHALWVYQGGVCALDDPVLNPHSTARGRAIRLDHAHDIDGLVRGLLCQSCNCLEGKGGGAGSEGLRRLFWRYRRRPPAQAFAPTRGLTHAYMTSWAGDEYRRLMARAGATSDAEFFWTADV